METIEKLQTISTAAPSDWREKAQWRKDNRDWLRKSGKIALAILDAIDDKRDMTQKKLADMIGVSQQYISKVVKGQENLSLQTICKLEKALDITLISVEIQTRIKVENQCIFPQYGAEIDVSQHIIRYEQNYSTSNNAA